MPTFKPNTVKAVSVNRTGGLQTEYLDYSLVRANAKAFTKDMTEYRNNGGLCHREELDDQPLLENYLGPMWDGDCLRYETQEAYNILSN